MPERSQQSRRRRPLQVETLESLTLLSGLSLTAAHPAALVVKAAAVPAVSLSGTTSGAYVAVQARPVSGIKFTINTSGQTTLYGPVTVYGTLTTPGLKARGKTSGTLLIYTRAGNLTVEASGPVQSGFSGLPPALYYTITAGSGKFRGHFGGSGTIALNLFTGFTGPAQTTHGQITLKFAKA